MQFKWNRSDIRMEVEEAMCRGTEPLTQILRIKREGRRKEGGRKEGGGRKEEGRKGGRKKEDGGEGGGDRQLSELICVLVVKDVHHIILPTHLGIGD